MEALVSSLIGMDWKYEKLTESLENQLNAQTSKEDKEISNGKN